MLKLNLYPRHFLDANYLSIKNCPIARACKEQLGGEFAVGGTTVQSDTTTYRIENARQFSSLFVTLKARVSKMKKDEVVYTINLIPYD